MDSLTLYADWVAILFLIGYFAIGIEQWLHINKSATALLMAIACWVVLFFEPSQSVSKHLETLSVEMFKVTQVLFFLLGALIIVETINAHRGFAIVTRALQVKSKHNLYLLTGLFTFFLSAVLDNLTTTIVMISVISKMVAEREERWLFGASIVVAANAGGAWTPIGDVATTLLWISGQITAFAIMRDLFLPSLACLAVYMLLDLKNFKGPVKASEEEKHFETEPGGTFVLWLGISLLLFVPFFKLITGLPPFFGMLFGVAILWVITDLMHYRFPKRWHLRIPETLPKVDITVILFYLGILLAIYALDSSGILQWLAYEISTIVSNPIIIATSIGLASSLVDNVSLTAAAIGMYPTTTFAVDSKFWQLMAYCAGTGGSLLIIGSAAGVAFMSLEKVDFLWYLKKIAPKALLAYFAGILVYVAIFKVLS